MIEVHRNDEHIIRSILAWKRREHPKWSQYASEHRICECRQCRKAAA